MSTQVCHYFIVITMIAISILFIFRCTFLCSISIIPSLVQGTTTSFSPFIPIFCYIVDYKFHRYLLAGQVLWIQIC